MARPSAKVAIAAIALLAICGALAVIALGHRWTGTTALDGDTADTRSDNGQSAARVESFILSNGLEVVALPIAKAEKTVLMVWYRAGSADDPPGKSGLAHYVEHVTFSALGSHESGGGSKGTHRPDRVKSQPEAFTAYDYTAYYQVTSRERLDDALRLEADRMANLRIDEAAVNAERRAVFDEREHDVDGDPEALLEERLRAVLFGNGPYGRPVVAPVVDTARVSSADVRAFLDRWYSPSNAILIVAGDVDVDTLRSAVNSNFGQITGPSIPKRERPTASRHSERRALLESNRSPQALWGRTCLAPSFRTADPREVLSLQMLARILATVNGGRLRQAVIEDRRIAAEVVAEYDPDAVGDAVFAIHATLAPNADLAEFETVIESELADLVSRGVSAEVVAEARKAALAEYTRVWRDPFDVASMFGAALATGGTLADMEKWPQLVSSVEPQDIRAAARQLFAADKCAIGTLGASGE